ncbi:MAG: aminopeptidase P family protein [Clostridiales bacterium]|jgi:Xaa-Pro aminopeptidase|nr:aminopeptidase P family protein [Clostridiales bacterium]
MKRQALFCSDAFDAAIVISGVNKFYFTDFVSENSYLLLFKDGKALFFLDKRYTEEAREFFGDGIEVFDITSQNPYEAVKEVLQNNGVRRLGYEDGTVLHSEYEALKTLGAELMPASADIDGLRGIKDENETSRMQRAAEIADAAYLNILKTVREGVTEKDVADEIIYFMRRAGAQGASFDPIVAFNENTSRPHHIYGQKKLVRSSVVTIDIGAVYKGYCSDMTRSFVFGNSAADGYEDVYDAVLSAQTAALEFLAAGKSCQEADFVARGIIAEKGYGGCFTHSLGHSVGLEIHEEPRLSQKSADILKRGNVVTVEPGIYIEGSYGVRIEDMVRIADDGIMNFCKSEKKLLYI